VRQWPQMSEIVRSRGLIADVEGNFPELTWRSAGVCISMTSSWSNGPATTATDASTETSLSVSCENGEAVRVTDYWGEPTQTPGWRQPMTDRLEMPGDGIWPDNEAPRPLLAPSLATPPGRSQSSTIESFACLFAVC